MASPEQHMAPEGYHFPTDSGTSCGPPSHIMKSLPCGRSSVCCYPQRRSGLRGIKLGRKNLAWKIKLNLQIMRYTGLIGYIGRASFWEKPAQPANVRRCSIFNDNFFEYLGLLGTDQNPLLYYDKCYIGILEKKMEATTLL